MVLLALLLLAWAHLTFGSGLPIFFHGDLVVFGDSLSDDGIRTHPADLHGFKRPSNGPIWPEYLAEMLGLVGPCGHDKSAVNMAYSGALTNEDNYYFKGWSGVLWQIANFLNSSKDAVNPATTIFFIQAGINDLFDGKDNTAAVVENLATAVQKLSQAGFKNIIIFTVSDLSKAPGFKKDAPLKEKVKQLVKTANEKLETRLVQHLRVNPQLRLFLMDFNWIWAEVEQKFAYFDAAFDYRNGSHKPGDIMQYAWFDNWHPASGVHQILARNMAEILRENFGKLLVTPWEAFIVLCRQKLYGTSSAPARGRSLDDFGY